MKQNYSDRIRDFQANLNTGSLPELFRRLDINPDIETNYCPICGNLSFETYDIGGQYQWYCRSCNNGGGLYELLASMNGDIHSRIQADGRLIDVSSYVEREFDSDVKYFAEYKDRKAGFSNLDSLLTLYPGLMVIGGAAAVGKTTFLVSLCDNLARKGEHIVYFSLEQSPMEIITKLIARRVFEDNPGTKITNIMIKNGDKSEPTMKARSRVSQELQTFHIFGGTFDTNVNDIINRVNTYMTDQKTRPIVVVDYLQLIAPTAEMKHRHLQTRDIIDENIKALKKWQKDNELLVVLVSSFNRSSYDEPVSYAAFKESGAIEYTADYLCGLQLTVLEDPDYYSRVGTKGGIIKTTDKEKYDMISKAQRENPKQVEIKFLKNRNGKQSFEGFFYYHIENDAFRISYEDPRKGKALTWDGDDTDNPFENGDIL